MHTLDLHGTHVQMLVALGSLLALLLLSGCPSPDLVATHTIISLRSMTARIGQLPLPPSAACIWVVERRAGQAELALVLPHGTITAQECLALAPPGAPAPPPLPAEP